MSAITLSMTSSSFMLLQHTEFRSYDPMKRSRTRGINNPPMSETIIGGFLYLFLTVPRIFANSLILSITPLLAFPMYFIELCAFLIYSNRFVLPLKENLKFPSGTVQAFSNFFSACGPIDKVGSINLFSNCLLILKLILLYPILVLDKNNLVTVGMNKKPDWFRCWNESEANLHGVTSFNKCDNDENTTDLLFRIILPTTISMIIVVSIPLGFLISFIFQRKLMDQRQKWISGQIERLIILFSTINTICCCNGLKEKANKSDERPLRKQFTISTESTYSCSRNKEPRSFFETVMSLFINIRTIFHDLKEDEQTRKPFSHYYGFYA